MLSIIATLYVSIAATSAQLTGTQRTTILQMHNDFRAKVAAGNQQGDNGKYPKAVSMPALRWDNTLAELAQDWSTTCYPVGHEAGSKRAAKYEKIYERTNGQAARFTYNYDGVGENGCGNCKPHKAVTRFAEQESKWWDYNNKWDKKSGACTGIICGHLTGVIWAETRYVGCGWTKCGNDGALYCNYYPEGNIAGQYPYECSTPGIRNCPEEMTGTCCECSSHAGTAADGNGPPSKAKCNNACESAVNAADGWCKKNTWDQTCRNKANNLCAASQSFTSGCEEEHDMVCVDGLSLSDDEDGETKTFEIHPYSECSDGRWSEYKHAPTRFVNYYLKHWEETRNASLSGWRLTEELLEFNGNMSWWGEETVLATCYEDDLMNCANDLWADTSANFVVSECATTEERQTSHAPVIAVSLIVVLLVAAVIGVGFYCCVYKKNKSVAKGGKVVSIEEKGMITNDGMANATHGNETIDVEMEN